MGTAGPTNVPGAQIHLSESSAAFTEWFWVELCRISEGIIIVPALASEVGTLLSKHPTSNMTNHFAKSPMTELLLV